MKALTVQQPWAWAILHGKDIENRTQLWKYRGPLAIHAGARESERGFFDARIITAAQESDSVGPGSFYGTNLPTALTFSAILGVVDLVDCHPDAGCCQPWGEQSYVEHGGRERRRITHLVLENPRELAVPIPCKGALGLWTPPADVLDRLQEVMA